MNTAPLRDVVRVLDVQGPRRGRTLVCLLECGHWISRRARPGRFGVPCFGCVIEAELLKGKAPGPVELAERAVESAIDGALGEVHRQCGSLDQVLLEAKSAGRLAAQPALIMLRGQR